MRVALLGATGYIGRSLLAEAIARGLQITPIVRDEQKAAQVFKQYGITPSSPIQTYEAFQNTTYDLVINAAGIGSPTALRDNPEVISPTVEVLDAAIFSYLAHPEHASTRVCNMSSGAVHKYIGTGEVSEEKLAHVTASQLSESDLYGVAKLRSEATHRAHPEYAIIDLRIFTFFSALVDAEDSFFLSELARALKTNEVFVTNEASMTRDCITPGDLLDLVLFLVAREPVNDAYDVTTGKPFEKFELLWACESQFGLKWRTEETVGKSPTGTKNVYASSSTKLHELGFMPRLSAQEGVLYELERFLEKS